MIRCTPGGSVNVPFNWAADVLGDSGITVVSVVHTIDAPMSIVSQSNDTTTSVCRVTGAVHGLICMVAAAATLSNGEVVKDQYPVRGWNS